MKKVAVIIPTMNGEPKIAQLLNSLSKQSFQSFKVILIDSASSDGTVSIANDFKVEIISIERRDFNHGATRQFGADLATDSDIVVFLTQDAVLADNTSLERLINCFNDPKVGIVYGRQLPNSGAGPIEAHARLFNYPDNSSIKSFQDASKLGIKTVFISNSFAAYRRPVLMEVGGFPRNVILGEDTYVAARMLLNGWQIAYSAEAKVYHSHGYSFRHEFQRYFDIGVFHARESWLQQKFGLAEGEGLKFVLSELRYLIKYNVFLIPSSILRTILKLSAYRLGLAEKRLPNKLKLLFSMNKTFWK